MRMKIDEKVNRAKLSRSMSVPGAAASVILHNLLRRSELCVSEAVAGI
jgi:hypothetical protein